MCSPAPAPVIRVLEHSQILRPRMQGQYFLREPKSLVKGNHRLGLRCPLLNRLLQTVIFGSSMRRFVCLT